MSVGWTERRLGVILARRVGLVLSLLGAASCEQRAPDPPPPPTHHEPALAAPGALGARPASADEGVSGLLTAPPGFSVPHEAEPPDTDSESEPEPTPDGGHSVPAPPPHPAPPSGDVAL
jgi:hypothetical protein